MRTRGAPTLLVGCRRDLWNRLRRTLPSSAIPHKLSFFYLVCDQPRVFPPLLWQLCWFQHLSSILATIFWMLEGLLGKEVMGRGPSTWVYLILTFSLQRRKLLGQESIFLEKGRKGEQKAKNWEKATMMNLSPFFMIQAAQQDKSGPVLAFLFAVLNLLIFVNGKLNIKMTLGRKIALCLHCIYCAHLLSTLAHSRERRHKKSHVLIFWLPPIALPPTHSLAWPSCSAVLSIPGGFP